MKIIICFIIAFLPFNFLRIYFYNFIKDYKILNNSKIGFGSIIIAKRINKDQLKSGKYWNLGYVSEGLLGMGLFLGLLLDKKITPKDIENGIFKYLKTNGDKISAVNKKTKDKLKFF